MREATLKFWTLWGSANFITLLVFAATILATASCGYLNDDGRPELLKNDDDKSSIILEVFSESKFVTYPPGKTLSLRIYRSGEAEFDYYPNQDLQVPFFLERRSFKVSSGEMSTIKRLLDDAFNVELKSKYEPRVPIVDSSVEMTLTMNNGSDKRTVVLQENHSNLILEEKRGINPEPLRLILIFVRDKNEKLLSNETVVAPI